MTKQPLITDATRQGIADAFWEMYKTSAIEYITVSQVVKQAHVHRSTFYRYFKDVYDVLSFLEDNVLANISEQTSHLAGQIEDLAQSEIAEELLRILTANAEKIYYLQHKSVAFQTKLQKLMYPTILSLLEGDHTEQEADFLFVHIFSVILTNMKYWYEHQDPETLSLMAKMTNRIMLEGLYTFMRQ